MNVHDFLLCTDWGELWPGHEWPPVAEKGGYLLEAESLVERGRCHITCAENDQRFTFIPPRLDSPRKSNTTLLPGMSALDEFTLDMVLVTAVKNDSRSETRKRKGRQIAQNSKKAKTLNLTPGLNPHKGKCVRGEGLGAQNHPDTGVSAKVERIRDGGPASAMNGEKVDLMGLTIKQEPATSMSSAQLAGKLEKSEIEDVETDVSEDTKSDSGKSQSQSPSRCWKAASLQGDVRDTARTDEMTPRSVAERGNTHTCSNLGVKRKPCGRFPSIAAGIRSRNEIAGQKVTSRPIGKVASPQPSNVAPRAQGDIEEAVSGDSILQAMHEGSWAHFEGVSGIFIRVQGEAFMVDHTAIRKITRSKGPTSASTICHGGAESGNEAPSIILQFEDYAFAIQCSRSTSMLEAQQTLSDALSKMTDRLSSRTLHQAFFPTEYCDSLITWEDGTMSDTESKIKATRKECHLIPDECDSSIIEKVTEKKKSHAKLMECLCLLPFRSLYGKSFAFARTPPVDCSVRHCLRDETTLLRELATLFRSSMQSENFAQAVLNFNSSRLRAKEDRLTAMLDQMMSATDSKTIEKMLSVDDLRDALDLLSQAEESELRAAMASPLP